MRPSFWSVLKRRAHAFLTIRVRCVITMKNWRFWSLRNSRHLPWFRAIPRGCAHSWWSMGKRFSNCSMAWVGHRFFGPVPMTRTCR